MLKKRIVASLPVKDGVVVQSIQFKQYLPVGRPEIAIEFLSKWGIDEVILLDISATRNNCPPNFELIKRASKKCFVPLTVGGGITTVDHIRKLMRCGADKVVLNQALLRDPALITRAASVFGSQCIVASIDAVRSSGAHRVFDYILNKPHEVTPSEMSKRAEQMGSGEILIHSIDQDGTYRGYDIPLINEVCQSVKIPVICSGGAKNSQDLIKALSQTRSSAACASNFFHFTEHSVNQTKASVCKTLPVRLDTFANYSDSEFDTESRICKKPDQILEEMLFHKIEVEHI